VRDAWRTPQFLFLWVVLCANVSAGIGLLEQASPMIQEVFRGRVTATAAAGFVGLLSLFNIAGRIGWASLSDRIGRRATYTIFFALGIVLYASLPIAGRVGGVPLFVGIVCLILSMYGGGFATIPAYLADLFGTQFVGAIHGRLLTAWSVAGVLGPLLVNGIRQSRIDAGAAPADAYNTTMWALAALLVAGLIGNLLVRPLADDRKAFAADRPAAASAPRDASPAVAGAAPFESTGWPLVFVSWAPVGCAFAWGVLQTLGKASLLFR
jgi:MFS family permease